MNPAADLVNKLWRLCALLRKDGVTYQQYVTELTYLLFLKMASEQKDESRIPEKYRWSALKAASETEVLQRYRQALIDLGDGTKIADRSIVAIFQNATTIVREPANLRKLINAIDGLHWFSEERDAFGDAYEGLLQKMAEETKRGAGQYFTPRVLIEVMVRLMQPQTGEIIQDPAAGTGGFLIAADRYMRAETDEYFSLSPKQQAFQLRSALRGLENVPDTFRLLLMNLYAWLAFDWTNYRIAGSYSNSPHNGGSTGTRGKWDFFPLSHGCVRATWNSRNCTDEICLILDPTKKHDPKLMTFDENGIPLPSDPANPIVKKKVEITVHYLFLDSPRLIAARRKKWREVIDWIEEYRTACPATIEECKPEDFKRVERLHCRLADITAAEAPYAATARACLRANSLDFLIKLPEEALAI